MYQQRFKSTPRRNRRQHSQLTPVLAPHRRKALHQGTPEALRAMSMSALSFLITRQDTGMACAVPLTRR